MPFICDLVGDGFSADECTDILKGRRRYFFQRFPGEKRLMGSDEHIGQRQQFEQDAVFQYAVGKILDEKVVGFPSRCTVRLTKDTRHIISRKTIGMMKKGVMVINTSRGGLINTKALISGLREEIISCVGLDVYEEEFLYLRLSRIHGRDTGHARSRCSRRPSAAPRRISRLHRTR